MSKREILNRVDKQLFKVAEILDAGSKQFPQDAELRTLRENLWKEWLTIKQRATQMNLEKAAKQDGGIVYWTLYVPAKRKDGSISYIQEIKRTKYRRLTNFLWLSYGQWVPNSMGHAEAFPYKDVWADFRDTMARGRDFEN